MKIAGYEVHEAAELYPDLSETELGALVDNIREHGQLHPIVIHDGKILDGRHRAIACDRLGLTPTTISFIGDPFLRAWAENGSRRHMDGVKKGIAFELTKAKSEAWQKKQDALRAQANKKKAEGGKKGGRGNKKGTATNGGRTFSAPSSHAGVKAAAAEAGVNRGDLERARQLITELGEDGAKAVVQDTKTTGRKAHAKAKAEKRKRVEEAKAKQAPERAYVHLQQASEFIDELLPNSVDLLLTDPPYSTDVQDIGAFSKWVELALPKLKPTGRGYICIGAYPREISSYLGVLGHLGWLDRTQVLVWTYRNTKGPSPVNRYFLNWQAILYLWGENAGPIDCPSSNEQESVQAINAPDGRQGDRYHAWQKPDELAERFVRHSSKPGDLVVDPFTGTGTFLLAAARLGRRALGCDINVDNLKIAEQRGCVVEPEARRAG